MSFQILSAVLMPRMAAPKGRGRKPTAFPFEAMKVGDCFIIECDTGNEKIVSSWRRKLLVAKKRFNEKYPDEAAWEFKTRSVVNDGVAGIGVWRTK